MSAIELTSLRPSPNVEGDLEWYFQRAESELGIHSSFENMANQLRKGGGRTQRTSPEPEFDERRWEAISRMRRIHAAILQLEHPIQRTLAAAYEPRSWGPEVRRLFRAPIAGVAFMLFGDLNKLIQTEKKDAIRGCVIRCEKTFTEACAAYGAAKSAAAAARRAAA
jgi:hypothetical protein